MRTDNDAVFQLIIVDKGKTALGLSMKILSINDLISKLLSNSLRNLFNRVHLKITGLLQSFQTPKMCHFWLISKCERNCIKYQILIGIIPTFSENFIQINQEWPQLKPQT